MRSYILQAAHGIAESTKWQAPDRASVRFRDAGELKARQAAFQALICRWVEWV